MEWVQRDVRSRRSANAGAAVSPGDLCDADDESQRRRVSVTGAAGPAQDTQLQPDALYSLDHLRVVEGNRRLNFK